MLPERRHLPDLPRLPALTDAECSFIDHYLTVVDLLSRINPARSRGHAYPALRAAQSLPGEAAALLAALDLMWSRNERHLHTTTLTQALQALDGHRRTTRLLVPPA